MKTVIKSVILISLVFLGACSLFKTNTETSPDIKQKIESNNFKIQFNYAYPLRMKTVVLSSEYTLELRNDSVFAYLPYYGVAHTAAFNNTEGGIKFSAPMLEFTKIVNKRNTGLQMNFKVNHESKKYDLFLNVFYNGKADLQVSSFDRDAISFSGEIL